MMGMRSKECLHNAKPPHGTTLGPLQNPNALRHHTGGALEELKQTDEAIPTVSLVLNSHHGLLVTGGIIILRWRHRGMGKPDDETRARIARRQQSVPNLRLAADVSRRDRKDVNIGGAQRPATKTAVVTHLNVQETTRTVKDMHLEGWGSN